MTEFIITCPSELDADGRYRIDRWKELIRCKDCKYYHEPEYGFTLGDCTYGNAWFPVKEDGFCSDAKRKDN